MLRHRSLTPPIAMSASPSAVAARLPAIGSRTVMASCSVRFLQSRAGNLEFTQLFVNGKRQIRARYPNYDGSDPKHYSGYIPAAGKSETISPIHIPARMTIWPFRVEHRAGSYSTHRPSPAGRWARPNQAVIHIYQAHYWGNLQWRLKDIDWEEHRIWFGDGGHQMGAKWSPNPCEVNARSRFYIENVFEELDAPGEWYLDIDAGILYYMPPADIDLATAVIEVPVLQQAVCVVGRQNNPVRYLTLHGLRIAHTATTFLEPYEIPSLSDWAIHRGGAVVLEGTRSCAIAACWFDAVGGNGVFVNNYNRDVTITGCTFTESGDSAICFVGSLESTVGTQRTFPYECQAANNLIHDAAFLG